MRLWCWLKLHCWQSHAKGDGSCSTLTFINTCWLEICGRVCVCAGTEETCSHGRQGSWSGCFYLQYWRSGHRQGQHARSQGGAQSSVSSKYRTQSFTHTHKQYVRLHFNITNSPLMLKRVEVKLYWSDFRRDLFERGRWNLHGIWIADYIQWTFTYNKLRFILCNEIYKAFYCICI